MFSHNTQSHKHRVSAHTPQINWQPCSHSDWGGAYVSYLHMTQTQDNNGGHRGNGFTCCWAHGKHLHRVAGLQCWFVCSYFPSLLGFKDGGFDFCEEVVLMFPGQLGTKKVPGTRYLHWLENPKNQTESSTVKLSRCCWKKGLSYCSGENLFGWVYIYTSIFTSLPFHRSIYRSAGLVTKRGLFSELFYNLMINDKRSALTRVVISVCAGAHD